MSRRARSTFRILPRSGRIAWNRRLRPCLAEPPAVALDQEQLGVRRVALLAVGELAGQVGDVEHALAPGQLARLARRLARRRGIDHLGDDRLGRRRVLLEPAIEPLADHALHHLVDLGADQLVLGLRGELGVGHLDREHAGQALARVLAGQRHLLALGDAALLGVGLNAPGERGAQAGEMGAAVALRDVVGEAQGGLVVAVVPLQRGLDRDLVALALDQDRRLVQGGLGPVEIAHERHAGRRRSAAPPRPARCRARRAAGWSRPAFRNASSRSRCSSVW